MSWPGPRQEQHTGAADGRPTPPHGRIDKHKYRKKREMGRRMRSMDSRLSCTRRLSRYVINHFYGLFMDYVPARTNYPFSGSSSTPNRKSRHTSRVLEWDLIESRVGSVSHRLKTSKRRKGRRKVCELRHKKTQADQTKTRRNPFIFSFALFLLFLVFYLCVWPVF